MMNKFERRKGFTLLEVLLVVATIGILAGIVILAINPAKQLGDTRNAQRKVDVNTVLNAVYQYALDNNGVLPTTIVSSTCATVVSNEICRSGVVTSTCGTSNLIALTELTANEKYLVSLPIDPSSTSTNNNGAGYRVTKNGATNRVTVCAPLAEQGATISVTR